MNKRSIVGMGLVLGFAACSSESTPPAESNQTGAGGASGGSTSTGGSVSTAKGGGMSTGGNTSSGASGGSGPVTGGNTSAGTGTGGSAGAAAGGSAVGGSGGNQNAGTSSGGAEPGGAGSGGAVGGSVNSTDVTVQLAQEKQEIAGFGINNNWAKAMTDAEADAMFDVEKGLGLTILRIGMAASGGPFNGADCWSDINKAKARGATTIIGTLWTPPASCKTNNSENDGGHLKSTCYESWSDSIAAFAGQVKENTDLDLYAMSPQNEVDFASCGFNEPCNGNYPTTLFTAEEYVAFAKIVGAKLHALTPPVKLMGPEASEWLHAWSNESVCCSEPGGLESSNPLKGVGYDYGHALFADKEAWALLDIFGVHQYDSQVAEPWPADVPEKKPVWQTEMSGVKWWPEQGPSADINNAVAVAGWIHNALTVGEASAWLWWWWKAQGATNEGLLSSSGGDTKRRYAFGNYTRFIRPGYKRVEITGNVPADVLLTAFKSSDGKVVVVAINKGSATATVPVFIAGGTAPASVTPWITSASDDLVSKTAVMVTGGSFSAELASKTVTTFVGG